MPRPTLPGRFRLDVAGQGEQPTRPSPSCAIGWTSAVIPLQRHGLRHRMCRAVRWTAAKRRRSQALRVAQAGLRHGSTATGRTLGWICPLRLPAGIVGKTCLQRLGPPGGRDGAIPLPPDANAPTGRTSCAAGTIGQRAGSVGSLKSVRRAAPAAAGPRSASSRGDCLRHCRNMLLIGLTPRCIVYEWHMW